MGVYLCICTVYTYAQKQFSLSSLMPGVFEGGDWLAVYCGTSLSQMCIILKASTTVNYIGLL